MSNHLKQWQIYCQYTGIWISIFNWIRLATVIVNVKKTEESSLEASWQLGFRQ